MYVLFILNKKKKNQKLISSISKDDPDNRRIAAISALQSKMKDPAIQKQIDDNMQLAQALHLIGTPSFVIGLSDGKAPYQFIPGATDQKGLEAAIQKVQQ